MIESRCIARSLTARFKIKPMETKLLDLLQKVTFTRGGKSLKVKNINTIRSQTLPLSFSPFRLTFSRNRWALIIHRFQPSTFSMLSDPF